jgi:hypothetical protein
MPRSSFALTRNKTSVALLVLALVIGGISAQATGILNLTSGGYLVCVHPKTKVVTHPSTSKCPKGYEKLILGAQGDDGTVGITGAAGLSGVDGTNGIDGKNGSDGKTLWNGTTDPASTWGAPGDMFINSATKVLFGPKDLTTGWPAGIPMLGLQGVKGDTGERGLTGPQGSTGATGSSGANGTAGSNGSNGARGSDATLSCAQGVNCAVGDTGPGGGIVFYVQTATAAAPWRYLEAAPNTWSGGVADPTIAWCSNTSTFVSALTSGGTGSVNTSTAIGSGFSNTKMMIGSCTYGAANMAASYNGGGKSDWFLPSKDELNALYLKKAFVGGFGASAYWPSSEYVSNSTWSWEQMFTNGVQDANVKSFTTYVRPIRAF